MILLKSSVQSVEVNSFHPLLLLGVSGLRNAGNSAFASHPPLVHFAHCAALNSFLISLNLTNQNWKRPGTACPRHQEGEGGVNDCLTSSN